MTDEMPDLPASLGFALQDLQKMMADATGLVLVRVPVAMFESWEAQGLIERDDLGMMTLVPAEE